MSPPGMADPHQLFDDTSSAQSRGFGAQRGPGGLGYPAAAASPQEAFLADPVSNMAMAYGSSLAAQGKELVDKNVSGPGWGTGWGPWGPGVSFALCLPRLTASSPSPSSSITSPWTPCMWAKSWACSSSPTCTRSAPPTEGPGLGGDSLWGRCEGQGGRSPALGVLPVPPSPHRTGRCSTSRTPQWPPALTSTRLTSTFQVSPTRLHPGTLLPLGGQVSGGGLGARRPRRSFFL